MRSSPVSRWRDCIVVLMDLIDVKKRANEGDARASTLMRSFHDVVRCEMDRGLEALSHAYVWNDSVVLLASVDGQPQLYEAAIHAADDLKRKVDTIAPSYGIAVKGRAFPTTPATDGGRVTVIKASSYAMANCFEIEAEARRKALRKAWYVDARIARQIRRIEKKEWIAVPLLPGGLRRRVYLLDGYLWGDRSGS